VEKRAGTDATLSFHPSDENLSPDVPDALRKKEQVRDLSGRLTSPGRGINPIPLRIGLSTPLSRAEHTRGGALAEPS